MQKNKNGFTIVELIIVIVVIGILATISLTVFGSIKKRAQTARTDTAIRYIMRVMEVYKAENGHYPYAPLDSGATCLSYDACFDDNPEDPSSLERDATLEDEFKKIMGNFYQNIHTGTTDYTISDYYDVGLGLSGVQSGIVYAYYSNAVPWDLASTKQLRTVMIYYAVPGSNYVCPGETGGSYMATSEADLEKAFGYSQTTDSGATFCRVDYYEIY